MTKTTKPGLPGDLAMWFFIFSELLVFAVLFLSYTFSRASNIEMFREGQKHLNTTAGVINTLALITASYFVVKAVNAIRVGNTRVCIRWLIVSVFTASIYILVKFFEYKESFSAGFSLGSNKFYFFYFFLTFFHLMHVCMGIIILLAVAYKAHHGMYSQKNHNGLITGASYWHMVDLVWVILFPLLYVIR